MSGQKESLYLTGFQINQIEQILEEDDENFKKITKETEEDKVEIQRAHRDLQRNLDRIKFKHKEQEKALDEIEKKYKELKQEFEDLNNFINQRPPAQSDKNQWIFGNQKMQYLCARALILKKEMEKLHKQEDSQIEKDLEIAYLQPIKEDSE